MITTGFERATNTTADAGRVAPKDSFQALRSFPISAEKGGDSSSFPPMHRTRTVAQRVSLRLGRMGHLYVAWSNLTVSREIRDDGAWFLCRTPKPQIMAIMATFLSCIFFCLSVYFMIAPRNKTFHAFVIHSYVDV